MYDGIGEALLLGTFGVDCVHLWHYFDPEVSDEEYNNHKQVLRTVLNQIGMINYDCQQLPLADKERNSDRGYAIAFIMNSLRHDDDALIIRNIIKKAYRIV